MLKRFSYENAFELAYKKLVHFKVKNAYKKFEKNIFEEKNRRDSSLGHNKGY
jgi:hypothetical protein